MNRRKTKKPSSSRFKGVSWIPDRKKWGTYIAISGKRRLVSRWQDEEDAAIAYNVAAQFFFGAFARLNEV